MRRLLAVLLILGVVIAAGCIGDQVGLTKEKVLNAINSIERGEYTTNASVVVRAFSDRLNSTMKIEEYIQVNGAFDNRKKLEKGHLNVRVKYLGIETKVNWPYFANGSDVYFNINGKWYSMPLDNELTEFANSSLNVDFIEKLLSNKEIEMKRIKGGYYFKTNITFGEILNATGREFINTLLKNSDIANITTKSGYIEVKIRGDGMPYWIHEYLNVVVSIRDPIKGDTANMYLTINETTELRNINGDVIITTPKGIEEAKPLDDVLG
ncbi:hypothetical protein [Thermococcus sp. AM4]|uniref:hypothetical protein n=1 Tax=Thermococcus sp. (strain AM4) TaxID=246969 RepID=UPI0001870A61|nr:hypothetical protein [Thermococcus sp. AM4]EEB73840.1 hypothetical protein TAM4_128 [Thermococcus sp. AM4]